jgi:hypothetical protein
MGGLWPFGQKDVSQVTGGSGVSAASQNARDTFRQQLKEIEWLTSSFFYWIVGFVLFYSVGEAWRLSATGTLYRFDVLIFDLGILLGLTAAAAVIGGLLGFLFGIPRTIQGNAVAVATSPGQGQAGGAPAAQSPNLKPMGPAGRAFAGNSNLEEISDWLTKIIVGVSLVQAGSIYTMLIDIAGRFKSAIPNSQGADVVFVIVLISGLIGGFLFLYLETRTRVMWLFTNVEEALFPQALMGSAIKSVLQTPIDTGHGQTTTHPSSEDEQLLKVPYEALQTGEQLAAWGSAQARAGRYQAATQALQDAIAKEPDRNDFLLRLADVRARQGIPQAAMALISEAQQKGDNDPALLKRELYTSLYLPPPDGFQKALRAARLLSAHSESADDAYVHLWIAAAQGQRFAWLSQNNGSEAEKIDARKGALEEVRRVTELVPNAKSPARGLLRNMLDPDTEGADPEENDLVAFKNDSEFRKLIAPNV